MNEHFKIVSLFVIGISLIVVGASMEVEKPSITMYIQENWSNVTWVQTDDYPDDWNCVDISNSYMKNNNDWCILGIRDGSDKGHAVNYQERGDVLFIHDETWGCEYELVEWRSMTVHRYACGVEAPQGVHFVYMKDGFVVKTL